MGFHNGAFATIWDVSDKSDNFTKVRMTVSRKDTDSDSYITDFRGFVALFGEARKKIKQIESVLSRDNKCRIKIVSCDVSNKYDKDAGREFVNFSMFEFEFADGSSPSTADSKQEKKSSSGTNKKKSALADDDEEDGNLPF